jgi:DNA-binding NarL/FixJ family response regulator
MLLARRFGWCHDDHARPSASAASARGPGESYTRDHYYSGLTAAQRDAKIVELRRRGWKLKEIAAALNMSISGVSDAVKRVRAGGRPGRDPRG